MEDVAKSMDQLEERFPLQSGNVVKSAFEQAIASGQKVLESVNGVIVEVSAEGIKKIRTGEPDLVVAPGTTFKIS